MWSIWCERNNHTFEEIFVQTHQPYLSLFIWDVHSSRSVPKPFFKILVGPSFRFLPFSVPHSNHQPLPCSSLMYTSYVLESYT